MQHIQARNYYKGRQKKLRLIVWHDMEVPESAVTAEAVARRWAGPDSPKSSAHLCADPDSAVTCVHPEDTAWAAPGANADGYQVELAGFARQTAEQWLDAASKATIRKAIPKVVEVAKRYGIPARWLTDEQLLKGEAGHTTHAQISRVFKKSTHTDPGQYFPKGWVMEQVKGAMYPKPPAPAPAPTTTRLAEDGKFGVATIKRWQQVMRVPMDGVINDADPLIKAVQRRMNQYGQSLVVDGDFGPKTKRGLQRYLGHPQTGTLTEADIRSLQHRLNGGKF